MKLPRFLYTSRPGKGFASYSSPAQIIPIPERLKERIRQPLSASNSRNFQSGLGVTLQEPTTGRCMVCTYLQGTLDEYKRPFVLSHSALLSVSEYQTQALHFDRTILAPLRQGVASDVDANGNIEPLESPDSSGRLEIREEELATLNRFTDETVLKRLLACLFAEKSFTLRIKESPDTAISLAVTLLKLAAKQGATASIATFEPADRSLYMSRVLPDAKLRTEFEFSLSGETTDRTAVTVAERVAIDVLQGNYPGIAAAIDSGNSRAETGRDAALRTASVEQAAAKPAPAREPEKPPRRAVAPQPETGKADQLEEQRKEWIGDWDAKLRAIKEHLDKREGQLNQRESGLNERQAALDNRDNQLRQGQKAMEEERAKVKFWKALSDADQILDRELKEGFQAAALGLLKTKLAALKKDKDSRDKNKKDQVIRVVGNEKLIQSFNELITSGKSVSSASKDRADCERLIKELKAEAKKPK